MAANYPKIVYTPVSTAITIVFVNGPRNFSPRWDGRVHDNLSTSGGVRERVTENLDILIDFEMQHMVVDADMPAWGSFLGWALLGGTFEFYPNQQLPDYYNCVMEGTGWEPKPNAPKKYASALSFRILQDGQCPAGPDVVLRRLYGATS